MHFIDGGVVTQSWGPIRVDLSRHYAALILRPAAG
jgi:hypothetical protein